MEERKKRGGGMGAGLACDDGKQAPNQRKPMRKYTQVDLLAKLCAMPGNGMIVDCRGFDRGIWLV